MFVDLLSYLYGLVLCMSVDNYNILLNHIKAGVILCLFMLTLECLTLSWMKCYISDFLSVMVSRSRCAGYVQNNNSFLEFPAVIVFIGLFFKVLKKARSLTDKKVNPRPAWYF